MGDAATRERTPDRRPDHAAGPGPAHTCQPGFDIAATPATYAALLSRADAGTRERLVHRLQERHGNAAVQRLVGAVAAGVPVQRWRVGLARGTTDCARIVDYINAHTPYAATTGWAQTTARFRWHGEPSYSERDGVLTATVTGPRVTPDVHVDMPEWSPTDPGISGAWAAMYANLRAHEARHEAIAAEWEATLLERLTFLSVPVADRRRETFTAAVQRQWDTWLSEHQTAQNAIDPYTAVLECPPEEAPEGEESESVGVGEEPAGGRE